MNITATVCMITILLLLGMCSLLPVTPNENAGVHVRKYNPEGEYAPASGRDSVTMTTGSDTFLCDSFGMYNHENSNFGGDPTIYLAWESSEGDETFFPFRGLISFEIDDLPSGVEITSVTMKLYYEMSMDLTGQEGGVAVPLVVSAHPVTRSWTEGTNTWGDGQPPNGATWRTHDGSEAWGNTGGDYDSQTKVDATTPGAYGWVDWDISDIFSEWLDEERENHGLILITHNRPNEDSLKQFTSFGGQNNKPHLVVEYEEPNTPPEAVIDTIDPNPIKEYTNVTLTGHGDDLEDEVMSGFMWRLNTDYTPPMVVGTQPSVTLTNLTAGTYFVSLRVKDSKGLWSPYATFDETLLVTPDEPPARITDLEAEPHGGETGAINLSWSAVAEDGEDDDGEVTQYIVRYSDNYIDGHAAFDSASKPDEEDEVPEPRNPGRIQEMTITGLSSGNEYYFAVIAVDARGQKSPVSNIARAVAPDQNVPGMVMDLEAEPGSRDGEINLQWTATGDDEKVGRAARYEVRYSDEVIRGAWDWYKAIEIPNAEDIPLPAASGQREVLTVSGLSARTKYHFILKAVDEWDNAGPVSNVADSVAKDGKPPEKVTGLNAFDTPDDNGKSVTITWNSVDAEDFDHYNVYKAMTAFSNVRLLDPVKAIEDMDSESYVIRALDEVSIVDGEDYYFAVTAVDTEGNEDDEVLGFGPVMSLNNLKKAQWLSDPIDGETKEGIILTPSAVADVEILEISVKVSTEDLESGEVKVTKSYVVEGTVAVIGDDVDRIDLYEGASDDGKKWGWMPLIDPEKTAELNKHDLDYFDRYYAAFVHPEESRGVWLLNYQIVEVMDRDEAEDTYLSEEDIEYRLCAIAWTRTAEWNYDFMEFVPETVGTLVDSDSDNLPDTWEIEHFGKASLYGAADDPDEDGYSNLKEFQEDTDPLKSKSIPKSGVSPDTEIPQQRGGGEDFPIWVVVVAVIILVFGLIIAGILAIVKRSSRSKRDRIEPVAIPEPIGPVAPTEPENPCPRCNKPMSFKADYGRWQCGACGAFTYPGEEMSTRSSVQQSVVTEQLTGYEETYNCERCGGTLDYDYNSGEWVCLDCSRFDSELGDYGGAQEEVVVEEQTGLPRTSSFPALPPHLASSTEDTVDEGEPGTGERGDGRGDEVRASFEETRAMLDRAPPYIDVSKPRAVLERARTEMDGGELGKAEVSIGESKALVSAIHQRYTGLVTNSEELLVKIQGLKEKGAPTEAVLEIFNRGKDAMKNGDFDGCDVSFTQTAAAIDEAARAAEAPVQDEAAPVEEPAKGEAPVREEMPVQGVAPVAPVQTDVTPEEKVEAEMEAEVEPGVEEEAAVPPESAPEKVEKKTDALEKSLEEELADLDLDDLLNM